MSSWKRLFGDAQERPSPRAENLSFRLRFIEMQMAKVALEKFATGRLKRGGEA